MTDKFDQIAMGLLDGKGCAGGGCSASDIADAIREAVEVERKGRKELEDENTRLRGALLCVRPTLLFAGFWYTIRTVDRALGLRSSVKGDDE